MKILFYLPAVTPWWFDNVVAPMLRGLERDPGVDEAHVIVAPLWRNTGIAPAGLAPLTTLRKLRCHVIDAQYGLDAARDFREDATRLPGVIGLVRRIDADLTLARSADFTAPGQFPGTVRYLMEGAAPPFETHPAAVVLDTLPFAHGHMPPAAEPVADICAPRLETIANRFVRPDPNAARALLGLPSDRPVLAVPLHYEHEENLFLAHAAFADSLALIGHLHARLPGDVLLAIADHPLNRLHVHRGALATMVAALPGRAMLCTAQDATAWLAVGADAMVSDLSKSWSLAAFHGTPVIDLAGRMAPWTRALDGVGAWHAHAAPRGADRAALMRWYGWHLGGRLLDPVRTTLAGLLRRVDDRPAPEDIADNLAALEARHVERAA
jgi:hypothetical protein